MALKSWALANCPYKSLTGSGFDWEASSVTGEYYYTGTLIEKPSAVCKAHTKN